MNIKRTVMGFMLGVTSVGLVACSNAHKSAGLEDAYGDGSMANGVQTAGLGEMGQYRGDSMHGSWMDGMTRQVANQLGVNDNTVYFAFDSSAVEEKYNYIVQVNANYLKAHPSAHLRLEGNTDPKGSREYNIGLGQRRASSVEQRLMALGVSSQQLTPVSYGEERPAVPGDTEEAYALDRRVNLVYTRIG